MKRIELFLAGAALWLVASTSAEVAVVVEHRWTIDNNYFSAFAYDPILQEFRTGGYSSNQTVRWSHILDDSLLPWDMEGDVVLNWFQLGLFARDGFASNSGSFSLWGMNFNPLDHKYFMTGIGILKPPSGPNRLDEQRDLIIFDDRLPDSLLSLPTGTTLSNTGGVYRLTDTSQLIGGGSRAAFLSSGVQAGDRITLFPVDIWAEVLSGTYTVTQVVSETEIRLDRDPCWGPNTVTTGVGYLLSIQPHLTLGTFRQNIQYYADNPTKGPKAHNKGGLSVDGLTLYLGDIVSRNLIAVNTQQKEDFSIFISDTQYFDYVADVVASGRHHGYIRPEFIFTDALASDWSNESSGVTLDFNVTDPVWNENESLGVSFDTSGAQVEFNKVYDPNEAELQTSWFEVLTFAIHGGAAGGQLLSLYVYDTSGTPGDVIAIDPPTASTWTHVAVPTGDLGVSTIGGVVLLNDAAGAQPEFFLDQLQFVYTDPPPGEIGDFDPNVAGPAAAQIAVSSDGRVFSSETQTDDIIWTSDGNTLHTFLSSNEIAAVTQGYSNNSAWSTGLQVLGLEVDRMGTVYWSDNRTRAIWKAPACGGMENIRCLASNDELKTSLRLRGSPRGMSCFAIRGTELLTFNFVEGNFIYKVDLNTFDYGDFDGDVDVDISDLEMFASVMLGPDEFIAPTGQEELFLWSDLDLDGDVDVYDAAKLQCFATGELPSN